MGHRIFVRKHARKRDIKKGDLITKNDYENIRTVMGNLPVFVKDIRLIGSVATRGQSKKDLDILVVLNSDYDNAWERFIVWMGGLEFEEVNVGDPCGRWIDPKTEEVFDLDTWKWKDITVDVFYAQSEDEETTR